MFKVLRLIHSRKRDGFGVHLSPPEFMSLKFFEENVASTSTLLASHMSIRKPTATILVQKLIFKGLLKKESNKNDSRSFHIELTEKGKAELKTTEKEFAQFADPIFNVLTAEEQKTLSSLFQKIISQNSHD